MSVLRDKRAISATNAVFVQGATAGVILDPSSGHGATGAGAGEQGPIGFAGRTPPESRLWMGSNQSQATSEGRVALDEPARHGRRPPRQ